MKRTFTLILSLTLIFSVAACDAAPAATSSDSSAEITETSASVTTPAPEEAKYQRYTEMTPEEIVSGLTLEQKAAQMVQPSKFYLNGDISMKMNCYGSVYAESGAVTMNDWRKLMDGYQNAAISSGSGIPFICGQDDAHGVGYCTDAVYFPHNIGQGAADDEELEYQMGLITAEESRLCHMPWNLYPCVAQSEDPRWGRTYESYGSDLDAITRLSTAYTKGLIDGGAVACAKHFFGDGNVEYGTGDTSDEQTRLLDRGNSQLTDDEIKELLKVYQAQIDCGVQTIMVSFSALNGKQMHEYGEYIWKLKNEMGFKGFIISDYEGSQRTSAETYEEQIILGVNSGIDMFMEVQRYDEAMQSIINGVKDGRITEDRLNDAVTRIIRVKKEAGLFDDPLFEKLETKQTDVGSGEYRAVAEKLVEESLVLVKNDKETLPLKEGTKVYITGPSADDARAQCGGWTIEWVESPTKDISGVTTIQKAFEKYASDYGIEVITDPKDSANADVVILCVGEKSYAEWYGDTADLELCGKLGLIGNRESIDEAKRLGKPTVACIIAGRNVIVDEEDYKYWDSVVMCYLPGSEGKGISDVLCGCADFKGKLPSPWYGSVDEIGTDKCFLERGYGLSYGDCFVPRKEPVTVYDKPGNEQEEEKDSGSNSTAAAFVISSVFGKTESGTDRTVTVYDAKLAEDICDCIMSGINWSADGEPERPEKFDEYYQVMMCLEKYSGYSFKIMEYNGRGYMYLSQDQTGSVLPKDKLIILKDAQFKLFKDLIEKIKP